MAAPESSALQVLPACAWDGLRPLKERHGLMRCHLRDTIVSFFQYPRASGNLRLWRGISPIFQKSEEPPRRSRNYRTFCCTATTTFGWLYLRRWVRQLRLCCAYSGNCPLMPWQRAFVALRQCCICSGNCPTVRCLARCARLRRCRICGGNCPTRTLLRRVAELRQHLVRSGNCPQHVRDVPPSPLRQHLICSGNCTVWR